MAGVALGSVGIGHPDAFDVPEGGLPRLAQGRLVLLLVLAGAGVVQVANLGVEFLGVLPDRIHLGLQGLGGFLDLLLGAFGSGALKLGDLGGEVIALLLGHLVLLAELLQRSGLRLGRRVLLRRGRCRLFLLGGELVQVEQVINRRLGGFGSGSGGRSGCRWRRRFRSSWRRCRCRACRSHRIFERVSFERIDACEGFGVICAAIGGRVG